MRVDTRYRVESMNARIFFFLVRSLFETVTTLKKNQMLSD